MADKSENVKIPQATLEIYREWADATGRSLGGLCNQVLIDAARHFLDGCKGGLNMMSKAKKES